MNRKVYIGQGIGGYGPAAVLVEIVDYRDQHIVTYPLPGHQEIAKPSPDGFIWGYEGWGPKQLAIAILMDLFDDQQIALRNYQHFQSDVIAQLAQGEPFRLLEQDLRTWMAVYAKE